LSIDQNDLFFAGNNGAPFGHKGPVG